MTVLNKTLAATSLILAGGLAYQLYLGSHQREHLRLLEETNVQWRTRVEQERDACDRAMAGLADTRQTLERLKTQLAGLPERSGDLQAWLNRVKTLKNRLLQNPAWSIPELSFLSSNDWLFVTLDNDLKTEAKIRDALSKLRALAKKKPEVMQNMIKAIQAYARDHDGNPITNATQLKPYLSPVLSDELLQRYESVPEIKGENEDGLVNRKGLRMVGNGRVVLQERAPVDEDFDTQHFFTTAGGGGVLQTSKLGDALRAAMQAYKKANDGKEAATPQQVLPYFTAPVNGTALAEYWEIKPPW